MDVNLTLAGFIIGFILIFSSLGMIIVKNLVHSCLFFLLSLLALSALYLELSASFIAITQILVYAGAILVLFMFVVILFQDAHQQVESIKPKNSPLFMMSTASFFAVTLACISYKIRGAASFNTNLPQDFGFVQEIGKVLYIDYAFPFEVIVVLFLVALIGALYLGKTKTT